VSVPEVDCVRFPHRGGTWHNIRVQAGIPKTTRIVPPAGEDYAFDRRDWPVNVEITSSPTGRSVQVWVNSKRVWPEEDNR
jgi:hypothetical protein